MNEDQVKELIKNQKQIIAQNQKLINILSDNSVKRESQYEDLKQMARKSPHGITRNQASVVLEIHQNNVGRHFEKIAEENEEFAVAEDPNRKGKPEILVHDSSTVIKGRNGGKHTKDRNLQNHPMLR